MRLDDEGITRLGTESSKVEGDALSHRPTHQVVARVYGVDASELAPRGRLVLPPRHIQDESVLHQFIEVDVERDVHENPASAAGTLLCCRNAVAADIVGTPSPAFMRVSGAKRSSQAENAGSIPVIRSKLLFDLAEQEFSTCIVVFCSCIHFLRLPRFTVAALSQKPAPALASTIRGVAGT
jgi:hypothetical protein